MLLRPCFSSTDDGACKEFCRVRTGSRLSAFGRKQPLTLVKLSGRFWPKAAGQKLKFPAI